MEGRAGLPKGTLLDGSYRIERVIGSGGFGITYEAHDVKLNTHVAIKEYYPGEFGHRDASLSVRPTSEKQKITFEWGRDSFLREARILARFRHPSVVQVTRVFEAYSTAYMVMIFEEGPHFEAWLRSLGRPPTQEELDRIAGPLLDALEMMHAQSFLHRDIAPDNIIVRADGTPVLLDFGAARVAVAEMTKAITGIVKPGYSPHEQYATDGRLQGPWTDLYAFGATVYRAVTGKPPEEATLRVTDDGLVPAAAAATGTYRSGFLSAIDVCLKVAPSARPQSVAQLRPMLFAPAPVTAVPRIETRKIEERKPARVSPARRSTKAWSAVAAVIAIVGGGVFGGLQYARWDAEERGRVEAAAKRKAEKDAQRRADAAAAIKRAEEEAQARERTEAETKRRADEEAKRKEEARRKAEEEANREAEAKRRAEEEAKREPWKPPLDRVLTAEEERRIRPGQEFQECKECPRMMVVPAGEFMMGSDDGARDQKPVHKVTIAKPLAVGKFEVTFAEWDACVSAGGCHSKSDDRGWGRGKRPVMNVSWDEFAMEYLPWLARKTGKTYRLLTEAEWEYAARAGTSTSYSWGNEIGRNRANCDGCGSRWDNKQTAPVGSFQPNGFGLHDMHGNVREWVQDCYKGGYANATSDGTASELTGCSYRVDRGGSWAYPPGNLIASARVFYAPDARGSIIGFRLARMLNP